MLKDALETHLKNGCNGECETCAYGWDVAGKVDCLVNPTIKDIRHCYTCLIDIILENMKEGKRYDYSAKPL